MPDLYLYADSKHERCGQLSAPELNQVTERHKIALSIPTLQPTMDLLREAKRKDVAGLVIEVYGGSPTHTNLDLAQRVLRQGRKVFLSEETAALQHGFFGNYHLLQLNRGDSP